MRRQPADRAELTSQVDSVEALSLHHRHALLHGEVLTDHRAAARKTSI